MKSLGDALRGEYSWLAVEKLLEEKMDKVMFEEDRRV